MRSMGEALPDTGMLSMEGGVAAQPSSVRHAALLFGCKALMVTCFAATPFALWALTAGILVPFICIIGVMAGVFASFAWLQQGNLPQSAYGLIVTGMLSGICLSVLDARLIDFGFALTLLGPILAALIGAKFAQRVAWPLTAIIIPAVPLSSIFLASAVPADVLARQLVGVTWSATILYLAFALMVGVAAHHVGVLNRKREIARVDTFRYLIEHVQHSVIRLSAKGAPLFISNTSEKLFGCRRYELTRSGLVDRMHVQDRPNYLAALSDSARKGMARTVEVRMRKDHTNAVQNTPHFIWVEISISPVLGDGMESGSHELILLLRNISHRKEQEEKMRVVQMSAQHASDAKSKFLATIGHELRTPLNAIVGFSEMMRNEITGKLDDAPREYVDIIHKSGLHLLDVVNMLLDMSRIEAGKFELNPELFIPDDLIGPCVEMVSQLALERNIKLSAEQPTSLPTIVGDQRAYRQILINLLSNAIKFSEPDGQVKVSIKRQGADLNITIADQGIGMSSDVIKRVGEPFYQANEGATRTYEGAGLGLSIVKGLIDLHDGKLNIVSKPGRGTTMTVLLPIAGPKHGRETEQSITKLCPELALETPSRWTHPQSVAS